MTNLNEVEFIDMTSFRVEIYLHECLLQSNI